MSAHPALLASLKRHDRAMALLTGLMAALLVYAALQSASTALGVGLGLGGFGLVLLMVWRAGGSLWTRLVVAGVNALLVVGLEQIGSGALPDRALAALMAVVLCLFLPYRDWRPIVLAAVVHVAADMLFGEGRQWVDAVFLAALTLGLVWLSHGMAKEAGERFELEFLVNAMGRDGPIRLNLDVVRAESKVGLRLKHIQGRMADALRLVRDATGSVQSVSSELGTSAAELRERTEHTARGLQDAAMSLEQINVIVQESARASREAKSLASNASTMAEAGGDAVGKMVQTMSDIDGSSRRITDIIGTIDGIAFQTNILALNAAVEAARAGEAGRGFAVVATEVRMLAGRSSEAAREIKKLIAASLETVERGTREARAAGDAMRELVQAVQGVGSAFENLSADSAEHAASIDVVTASVKELDQVTSRNLDVAVRGSQIASELLQQSVQLAEVLTNFRLGDDARIADLLVQARSAAAEAERVASSHVQRGKGAGAGQDAGSVDFF